MQLKKFHIGPSELILLALVVVAVAIRFILIRSNWPVTDSDEATIDLMALHIAYRGEHPIFFYGQNYMGAFEAYLGAPFFRLFGASVFTMRLALLPLYVIFLLCMYFITSLLYTKNVLAISNTSDNSSHVNALVSRYYLVRDLPSSFLLQVVRRPFFR